MSTSESVTATEARLRETLNNLTDAVRIILLNEVPSDEAWRDLNDAYDAALASPPPAPEPSESEAGLREQDPRDHSLEHTIGQDQP